MAISDYTIEPAEINEVHVEAQPTVLRGTATQNKKVFDKYCDLIVTHFNGLVGELDESISPEIDSDVIDLYISLGWTQS